MQKPAERKRSGASRSAKTSRSTQGGPLVHLQAAAGNHAVGQLLRTQRVAITGAATSETLYNQAGAGGTAGSAKYSINANYEMTRQGDTGATVQVKIKYLNQARNTVPPGPSGGPAVGQLVGPQTEIPDGDPRRAWATTMANEAVKSWNGRLTLLGEEWNAFKTNTKKSLPVTFQAVPVWGLNDPAHNTVIVHPPATVGGSAGNPIDAGNYYVKKNDNAYPADDKIIYAHEYGHLIGIPDEYSQSNAQMNALLHQAAPDKAASSLAALDKKTVERMTLAALIRPLYAQFGRTVSQVTDAISAQAPLVKKKMSAALRAAVGTGGVKDALTENLKAGADPKLGPEIPGAVAFETGAHFSASNRAEEGITAGFDPATIGTALKDAYWKALVEPMNPSVAVDGLGDVKINIMSSIYGAAGSGTALAGDAAADAAKLVGPVSTPTLPVTAPPSSLIGQLAAIPATWGATGGALATAITPDAFATKMQAAIGSVTAAEEVADLLGMGGPKMARTWALYKKGYGLLANASNAAAQQLAADLVPATITPALGPSITALQSAVATEVTRLMTASPTALATAPPDANMAAIVAAMKTKLDTAKAATAGSGRDPLGAGKAAPDQDVTYSYQGLMGSNATTALRADQFQPVVDQFNSKLKGFFETKPFTAQVK